MEIKKLGPGEIEDFKDLIRIFKEVFENTANTPDDNHLIDLLGKSDFIVFVAKVNNKVVGGLSIYILHTYHQTKPLAYIYDVGISASFQRKGIGKALINEVCNYCRLNGFSEAYVEAELDDLDAVNFYRKTRFSSELKALHFTYDVNNLLVNY